MDPTSSPANKRDRIAALRAWSGPFLAAARQLDQPALAVEWFRAGVAPEDAAAWANLGYKPHEAAPLIADGITPDRAREMERHAEDQAGGADALAAERIAHMIEAGEIVDPARAITIPDPDDPRREIIALRDDPDHP